MGLRYRSRTKGSGAWVNLFASSRGAGGSVSVKPSKNITANFGPGRRRLTVNFGNGFRYVKDVSTKKKVQQSSSYDNYGDYNIRIGKLWWLVVALIVFLALM